MTKITSVSSAGGYSGNYGTMYVQLVTLDNGQSGEVSAKTENRWSVGDEVVAEVTGKAPNGNAKLKLSKPESGNFQSGGSRSFSPDKEKDIIAGMISNQIVQLVCSGKIESIGSVTDGAIQELVKLRERIKANV